MYVSINCEGSNLPIINKQWNRKKIYFAYTSIHKIMTQAKRFPSHIFNLVDSINYVNVNAFVYVVFGL